MRRKTKPKATRRKTAGKARTTKNSVRGHTRNPRGPDRGKPTVHVRPYRRRKARRK